MTSRQPSPLLKVLRQFRGAFLAVVLFSLCISVLQLALPIYIFSVFTLVFNTMSAETLLMLTLMVMGAILATAALELVRGKVLARVAQGLDARLGRDVLEAVLRTSGIARPASGQSLRDVTELRGLLTGSEIYRMVEVPLVPLYIGALYFFHPTLAWVALAGTVVLMVLAVVNEVVSRPALKKMNTETLKGFSRVDDYVRSADAIQAMGMVPAVVRRWERQNQEKLRQLSVASGRAVTVSTLARFVRMALQVALYGVGAYLFLQHELLVGAMIAANMIMSRGLAPVEASISTWKTLVSGHAAYGRLSELLAQNLRQAGGLALPAPEGRLQVEKVTVISGSPAAGQPRVILQAVSFDLEPGKQLGIVGPSGAGKTTLGRVIAGVIPAASGAVRLDGADLRHWDPDQLGRHMGYLPQEVQLFSGTVAENVARMAPTADLQQVIAAARLTGAHEMIQRLPKGYETDVGENGSALSAGQRQHIGLARAFFGNPRLVVLDEPNSNLDSESEQALVRALGAARAAAMTVIVITHRPSLLDGADKLLVLRNGNVELFGPRSDVLARILPPGPAVGRLPAGAPAARLQVLGQNT